MDREFITVEGGHMMESIGACHRPELNLRSCCADVTGSILLALFVSAFGGCGKPVTTLDPWPEMWEEPPLPLETIVVIPSLTMVAPPDDVTDPTRLTLSARLFDSENDRIAELFYSPQWEADQPWIEIGEQHLHSVEIIIKEYPPSGTRSAIFAYVGDVLSEAAAIEVVGGPDIVGAPVNDAVFAVHESGAAPAIAVLNGDCETAASPYQLDDDIMAFVREGVPGSLVPGSSSPGSVTVFSDRRGVWLDPSRDWSASRDKVDVRGAEIARDIPVVLWIAPNMDPEDPLSNGALKDLRERMADFAVAETELANSIFEVNLTGISFTVMNDLPNVLYDAPYVFRCDDAHPIPGALNVYYVNVAEFGGKGLYCEPGGTRTADVILIAANHDPTSLAHELGHAMGLLHEVGHTNDLAGFGYANVMHPVNDYKPILRDHFSLGQAYRMNVDKMSWLNIARSAEGTPPEMTPTGPLVRAATEFRVVCPRNPQSSQPCPLLNLDITKKNVLNLCGEATVP